MPGILRTIARVANRHDRRPLGFRERPECIVLAARDGVALSAKPPVRIFVGTEPEQYRAERVFVWSIEQTRDPARTYEIHLMGDLAGFDRRRWLTGFTNYRFAIPHFAGGRGRAIYNDVDQVYLSDPAELFDMDMGQHGFLSLTDRDTSVMLIDCARMGPVWTLDLAQRRRRKPIEARARAIGNLWGPLAREWNARDDEYAAGRSKVLHYTTIHTQPWQPFPERYVYQRNSVAHVWLDMERAADAARYQLFSAQRPSAHYRASIARLRASSLPPLRQAHGPGAAADVEQLLAEARASSVLDFRLGAADGRPALVDERAGRTVTRFDALESDVATPADKTFDAVICAGALDCLPQSDVPWLLDTLLRAARRCLYLVVHIDSDGESSAGMRLRPLPQSWWLAHVERASAMHPDVHWKLVVHENGRAGPQSHVREGGRRADGMPPVVWVLKDHKAGHTTQSVGLADALGFPYEIKDLRFNLLNHFSNRVRGASTLGLTTAASAPLSSPWPDLVISTGRRTAPVARWIGQQSRGRTRLVQLGRRGGETVDAFDLVVACAHFRLPLHPRRMEITAPLNAVSPENLAAAAERWRSRLFTGAARPHIVLIAGGTCARYRFDAAVARRMGEDVRAFAASVGGTVFAITSPRTGAEATAALRAGLGESAHLHAWRPGEVDNPYMGHLALADAIVVTGESESMLAEAVAAAKPLFIYPLPERPLGFRRAAEWVARRAEARPRKRKGTVRPQQGLEYLCARLIAAGFVRPPRHLDQLHDGLVRRGAARTFGAAMELSPCRPLRDLEDVARRVRLLLGYSDAIAADCSARPTPPAATERVALPTPLRREKGVTPSVDDRAGRRVGATPS